MRIESAAMPAIPSPGSRSCRRDELGIEQAWAHWLAQQDRVLASGCELCRMIREPDVGEEVMRTGGIAECCTVSRLCSALRTLSFETERVSWSEDIGVVEARRSQFRQARQRLYGISW